MGINDYGYYYDYQWVLTMGINFYFYTWLIFYVSIQQFEALSPRNPLIYAAVYARGSSY